MTPHGSISNGSRLRRKIMVSVAWQFLGTPYRWGGDDPSGFDCSGLAIEALQSVGAFPRGHDTTAEGLRKRYPQVVDPLPGDLVFWLRNGKATHVGIVYDPTDYYIAAEGGDSRTQTVADAWTQNAYVCLRPIESRGSSTNRVFASPFVDDPVLPA